jgi:hypothetical protein
MSEQRSSSRAKKAFCHFPSFGNYAPPSEGLIARALQSNFKYQAWSSTFMADSDQFCPPLISPRKGAAAAINI